MKRIFSKTGIFILILALIAGIGVYVWQTSRIDGPPVEKVFQVEKIDTIQDIAKRLSEQGIIKYQTLFYLNYYIYRRSGQILPGAYKLSTDMSIREMVYRLQENPWSKYVDIPEGVSKSQIADILADALGWDTLDRQFFSHTYSGMQWQRYQELLPGIFSERYTWDKTKTETFLTLSALYFDGEYDFFKKMYVPGHYEMPTHASRAEAAGVLIDTFEKKHEGEIGVLDKFIDKNAMDSIAHLIDKEMVLMPDIVAIPPRDVTLRQSDGKTYLLFTTSYWNQGRGPLELVGDPKTKGKTGDLVRNVYQRIYHLDGNYTERLSGTFLWHQPHLHYHFSDFAIYNLDPVDIGSAEFNEKLSYKSTFCIRDSEPIDLRHPGASNAPSYTICGKERQGISPGWADSYYFTYVDQKFDVTTAPKGTYRLKITINPKERFEEISKENNVGEVLIDLDVKNKTVKVLDEKVYGL